MKVLIQLDGLNLQMDQEVQLASLWISKDFSGSCEAFPEGIILSKISLCLCIW